MSHDTFQPTHPIRKRRLPLSLRISLFFMAAALVPLLIMLAYSQLLTRPALIAQANTTMQTDAQSRAQLIDAYLSERMLDAETLTQAPTVQQFLEFTPQYTSADLTTRAGYALAASFVRDRRYVVWTLFDTLGKPRLSFPVAIPLQRHGQSYVPPDVLREVLSGRTIFSPVYYSPATRKAYLEIYAPIVDAAVTSHPLLGFMRATLDLDYIWIVVQSDQGANGKGSYAFLLDQNGVRIADTNAHLLFTAVAPLSTQVQQMISSENRYGGQSTVPIQPDDRYVTLHANTTLHMIPAGKSETYQVAQYAVATVPWTYFVLSPASTVTSVADEQLTMTIIIICGVIVLAALLGLVLGRFITQPILQSVERLRSNSSALKRFSTKQQRSANEQSRVIDSSQVGLESVQYYTDATRIAARRLHEVGLDLMLHWHEIDPVVIRQILSQMVDAARYIEKSVYYQSSCNQKLSTAIQVTTQVNEQLAEGASSASSAAEELEKVVSELRQVVGR
ncbi:MAG: cache domain-containing protein [Ktedonobacteraceae bacterium]